MPNVLQQPKKADDKELEIVCDACKFKFSLNGGDLKSETKRAPKGFIAVGFSCPSCEEWFHSYYTTPLLEQHRGILGRFANNSGKSKKHYENYLKKKAQFEKEHLKIQAEAEIKLRKQTM